MDNRMKVAMFGEIMAHGLTLNERERNIVSACAAIAEREMFLAVNEKSREMLEEMRRCWR